jgi:hypothetical protein
MALQDDLKARTSALISQQMANWVVEIQRAIQGHQAALVRALDELGESVARYDEKVDERAIAAAMAEVVARQPSAPAADYSGLKSGIASIEKGTNLSEVLTHLVTEASRQIDRAAMFIIKGNAAVGWYGRGFDHPEAVKTLSIPLTADTLFRVVNSSRHATRGHVTHSPGTTQALARLGGEPQGILAVPLILRDKVAAVLYCDTPQDEVPQGVADAIEIMVSYAGKVIDVLSGTPRPAGASATSPGVSVGTNPPLRAAQPSPGSAPPLASATESSGTSTVMWAPGAGARPAPAPARPVPAPAPGPPSARPFVPPAPVAPVPAPAPAPVTRVAPQDQKAHDDAKRFARLVVSEIKLYNEAKVTEGRRTKDIYERLKEDIERGRQMYQDRVAPQVRDTTDYFQDELVRILAGGDAAALGPM